MPPLERRVQQFRAGAYVWLAAVVALLARDATPSWPYWSVAALLPAMPWLLRASARALRVGAQDVENGLTPALITALSLPLLPSVAAVGALVTGVVAQRGWRGFASAAPAIVGGSCAGALVAPDVPYRATTVTDALSLAFMLAYTTPLCALGYEQTMRMYRMRERLRRFSTDLALQRDRLSRYVAAPVAARDAADIVKAPPSRRWLTVAFVDISDFTALTERLEPEDLGVLLDEFFAGLAELANRHRGNVHKFLGDGAMITFGDASSDGRRGDAQACVAMLGRLDELVGRLNAAARQRSIPAVLAVRAGVASGYCSVGDFGCGERLEYTMIGAPVNLASRIEGLASPGETWIAGSTRELIDDGDVESIGTFAVKGVAAEVAVFRLRAGAAP